MIVFVTPESVSFVLRVCGTVGGRRDTWNVLFFKHNCIPGEIIKNAADKDNLSQHTGPTLNTSHLKK